LTGSVRGGIVWLRAQWRAIKKGGPMSVSGTVPGAKMPRSIMTGAIGIDPHHKYYRLWE